MSLHGVTLGFVIGVGVGLVVALPIALRQFVEAWILEPLRDRRTSTQHSEPPAPVQEGEDDESEAWLEEAEAVAEIHADWEREAAEEERE